MVIACNCSALVFYYLQYHLLSLLFHSYFLVLEEEDAINSDFFLKLVAVSILFHHVFKAFLNKILLFSYTAVGVFVLGRMFREAWGAEAAKKQAEFNDFLEVLLTLEKNTDFVISSF